MILETIYIVGMYVTRHRILKPSYDYIVGMYIKTVLWLHSMLIVLKINVMSCSIYRCDTPFIDSDLLYICDTPFIDSDLLYRCDTLRDICSTCTAHLYNKSLSMKGVSHLFSKSLSMKGVSHIYNKSLSKTLSGPFLIHYLSPGL
jgi:hypothetical protein